MYRNVDDYHESRRRSHGRNSDDYRSSSSSSRKSRSRWDERKEDGEKSGSRRDYDSHSKRKDEDRYKSRWNDKDDYDRSRNKRADEHEQPSKARSTERRHRSRSRSPVKDNDREYGKFTTSVKEEKHPSDNSTNSGSANCSRNDMQYIPPPAKKVSSWSNSSDDDEQQPKSTKDSTYGSTISSKSSIYGEKSALGQREREYNDYTAQNVSFNQPGTTSEINSPGSKYMSTVVPGISLKLGAPPTVTKPMMPLPKVISVNVPVKSKNVAAVFNSDDEDEPEEMPAECRMRMKNVGRETKTSEGPNSFGKTKIGFCNLSHLAEKQLEGKPGANILRKKL